MRLHDQLEKAKAGFLSIAPEEARDSILLHIGELQRSGIAFGLKEGEEAPDFVLSDPLREEVTLYRELAKGPVVLTFYRGGWCPFCSLQLRAYQRILPEIHELGGQLIAVTPQSPDHTGSQVEKGALAFRVLSDPHGHVADRYGLLYELPEYLRLTFVNTLKRDLAAVNDTERWVLPVPGTFIVDSGGIVRRAHADPDFMQRMEPEEILDGLKELRGD